MKIQGTGVFFSPAENREMVKAISQTFSLFLCRSVAAKRSLQRALSARPARCLLSGSRRGTERSSLLWSAVLLMRATTQYLQRRRLLLGGQMSTRWYAACIVLFMCGCHVGAPKRVSCARHVSCLNFATLSRFRMCFSYNPEQSNVRWNTTLHLPLSPQTASWMSYAQMVSADSAAAQGPTDTSYLSEPPEEDPWRRLDDLREQIPVNLG